MVFLSSKVWRRLGAKNTSIIGTKWQSVTGRWFHVNDFFLFLCLGLFSFNNDMVTTLLVFRLASISVGQAGVWGISPKNEVNNSI